MVEQLLQSQLDILAFKIARVAQITWNADSRLTDVLLKGIIGTIAVTLAVSRISSVA